MILGYWRLTSLNISQIIRDLLWIFLYCDLLYRDLMRRYDKSTTTRNPNFVVSICYSTCGFVVHFRPPVLPPGEFDYVFHHLVLIFQFALLVKLDGLQCIRRHTAIYAQRERFQSAYSTGDTIVYLFRVTDAQAV